MSKVEAIERDVEKLSPRELTRLAAWFDQLRATAAAGAPAGANEASGAGWFDVYMNCPHSFDIPPRKKQFYKPKA